MTVLMHSVPHTMDDATDEVKMKRFLARIESGEKIEATDWMPDEYRILLLKLIHMHGVSEIMGAYPEKEWVPKAPTLRRKLSLLAKVQDEMGHGQLLLRVAEDLASVFGKRRDDLITEIFTGKIKFHNVFHMEAPTWADAGIIGWLVDGAAIITQTALLDCSYAPYARVLKRICAEESFHMHHGESIILSLAEGTSAQRAMLQEALNRWWSSLIFFFGPVEISPAAAKMTAYKIRSKTNEELRQKFFNRYVPRIHALGLTIPDDGFYYDEKAERYVFSDPDWAYFSEIVRCNNGPMSASRIELRRLAHVGQTWVREALMTSQTRRIASSFAD